MLKNNYSIITFTKELLLSYLFLKSAGNKSTQFRQAVIDAISTPLFNDLCKHIQTTINLQQQQQQR